MDKQTDGCTHDDKNPCPRGKKSFLSLDLFVLSLCQNKNKNVNLIDLKVGKYLNYHFNKYLLQYFQEVQKSRVTKPDYHQFETGHIHNQLQRMGWKHPRQLIFCDRYKGSNHLVLFMRYFFLHQVCLQSIPCGLIEMYWAKNVNNQSLTTLCSCFLLSCGNQVMTTCPLVVMVM